MPNEQWPADFARTKRKQSELPGRSRSFVRTDRKIHRKRQHERASAARCALDRDVAAEEPRQMPRQVQAQPGATHAPRGLLLHLPERVEDPLEVLGGDPNASVTHLEDHGIQVPANRERDPPPDP